ncbi:MAG: hypothetical protein ACI837_002154 [Crocinitomicaceae bacterium]|jgi:hypothetical protein
MKKISYLSLFLVLILSSCYKATEMRIMKGEWVVMEAYINGGSLNQMNQLLPQFETNGKYIVYMLDDGLMKAEYYIGDSLDYELFGEWELLTKDHIYMKIDEYIDGTYLIHSDGDDAYTMYAENNNVSFYEIGNSTMLMKLHRD